MGHRDSRIHKRSNPEDQRRAFQVDRDRVQYSSAFHRLAGITQIVRAGEAGVFHTRQQHTYKVAQVGRRLAEHCNSTWPGLSSEIGIDPEVVEAASLAHDLGHPPFGHAGEEELNSLVEGKGNSDGFEGNAQTFRIITKLAVRFPDVAGLNLTRATLAACLKYPWARDLEDPSRSKKWGVYGLDRADFDFAREYHHHYEQTAEAALMDWADDISYSVHDLEDFHRVGAIPWADVLESKDALVAKTYEKWFGATPDKEGLLEAAFNHILDLFDVAFGRTLLLPFEGDRDQRVALRNLTSLLIGRFIQGTGLSEEKRALAIQENVEAEVKLLKQITKEYITSRPALVAQQHGQRRIIRDLFGVLHDGSEQQPPPFLPKKLRYLYDLSEGDRARFAADCLCSLTEHEVVALHGRLFGSLAGSVLDPIVR